jgi:DNA-binding MarR family transcriptional regulator
MRAASVAWVVSAIALILLVVLIRMGREARQTEYDLDQKINALEQYIGSLVLRQLTPYPNQAQSLEHLARQLSIPQPIMKPVLRRLEEQGYIRILAKDRRGQEVPPQVILTELGRKELRQR